MNKKCKKVHFLIKWNVKSSGYPVRVFYIISPSSPYRICIGCLAITRPFLPMTRPTASTTCPFAFICSPAILNFRSRFRVERERMLLHPFAVRRCAVPQGFRHLPETELYSLFIDAHICSSRF